MSIFYWLSFVLYANCKIFLKKKERNKTKRKMRELEKKRKHSWWVLTSILLALRLPP